MKAKSVIFALIPPTVILSVCGYFFFPEDKPPVEPVPQAKVEEIPSGEGSEEPSDEPAKASLAGPVQAGQETAAQSKPENGETETEPKASEIVVPPLEAEQGEAKSDYYYKILTSNAESLSSNDLWRKFANTPDCLVTLVKVIDQLSNGNRPLAAADFDFLPVPAPFSAIQQENGAYVASPESMERFTEVIAAIRSVSSPNAIELLNYLEPELDRIVHETLGYPQETTFKTMLKEALTHVLATPLLTEAPPLVRLTARIYRYQDDELEKLSQAQKFMLRLGPKNQAELFEYLTKIAHNV